MTAIAQTRLTPLNRLAILLLTGLAALGWTPTAQPINAQQPGAARYTQTLKFEQIEPGIEYGQVTSGQATNDELTGPWLINVLRVDPQHARFRVVHALDKGVGLETVSSMALRHRATAAINGGYFRTSGKYRGESAGLLLLNYKLISEPNNARSAFGLIDLGNRTEVLFGRLRFFGEIKVGAYERSVQGLNRPLAKNELIVFTPSFHRTTLTDAAGIEVSVRGNRVTAVNDLKGNSEIPSDGYVISAVGHSRAWIKRHVRKGALAAFNWRLSPVESNGMRDWLKAHSLLGGGPQLIRGGKVAITARQEKMRAGFDTELHPRTAIAKLKSGKVLLVTVDGRQPGLSAGMSLFMLADLLLEFGAVEAINLDGGGSTTMVVRQKVVNRPSDPTGERQVSDAILVFPKRN